MSKALRTRALVLAGAIALVGMSATGTANADLVSSGTAKGFAITGVLADNELIPPTPVAEAAAPPFGEDQTVSQDTAAIPVDADPLAVLGVLAAKASVHQASDILTALEQPTAQQPVAGPYNAQGVGQIVDLEVFPNVVGEGIPVIEADLVRGEAVAVCRGGNVEYSASSEVLNIGLGGQDPLSGPVTEIIMQLEEALEPLAPIVNVELNVTEVTAQGASVDALVITLLEAAGEAPLVELRLGHAEVSGVACGGGDVPECSDTADNDGDGVIDAQDPGCHTDGDANNPGSYDPSDDSEASTQCSDTADNDGDGVIDAQDPGCHTDGDATNAASYDPTDNDETNGGGPLPKVAGSDTLPNTGGTAQTAAAAGLAALAAGLFALRRRVA